MIPCKLGLQTEDDYSRYWQDEYIMKIYFMNPFQYLPSYGGKENFHETLSPPLIRMDFKKTQKNFTHLTCDTFFCEQGLNWLEIIKLLNADYKYDLFTFLTF